MAHLNRELWPEEQFGFEDLAPAFAAKGVNWKIEIVRQAPGESRVAFDQRLAELKGHHPAGTLFVCCVRERHTGSSPARSSGGVNSHGGVFR